MRHTIFMLLICLAGSSVFAFTPNPENDSTEFYLDFILNRRVYTKVEEMPECRRDIFEFIAQIDFNEVSEKPITDTQVIHQIKRHAKFWTAGKHNGEAVPVKILYPFKLTFK